MQYQLCVRVCCMYMRCDENARVATTKREVLKAKWKRKYKKILCIKLN